MGRGTENNRNNGINEVQLVVMIKKGEFMKTFIEEYGVIIVASIAILALVAIATGASDTLAVEITNIIKSFTEQAGSLTAV